MIDSVWISKAKSKGYYLSYDANGILNNLVKGSYKPMDALTKRQRTEGHHKKKACICGTHSIQGHRERWKYPVWKKRRKKIEEILK